MHHFINKPTFTLTHFLPDKRTVVCCCGVYFFYLDEFAVKRTKALDPFPFNSYVNLQVFNVAYECFYQVL